MTYPWHNDVLSRIAALRDSDRLPNAMALSAPVGWGEENLLAATALSLIDAETAAPMAEFAHPDFRWVVPDGAEIKIDQVRQINQFAVQTAQSAPRKVVAILDAHLLNQAAANALLKTLEEPPPATHLLLATTNWGRLLPTIRSRCQRFVVAPDAALARAWLAEQGIDVSDAEFAECGRAPLTVQSVLAEGAENLTAWLATLTTAELSKAVAVAVEQGAAAWLGRWYRRLLMHLGGDVIPGLNAPAGVLHGFSDDILSARRQIETSNAANAQLLLENLVVRWRRLAG